MAKDTSHKRKRMGELKPYKSWREAADDVADALGDALDAIEKDPSFNPAGLIHAVGTIVFRLEATVEQMRREKRRR